MDALDIEQQLQERFSTPLKEVENRRIIVWHDAEGEFEEEFTQLTTDGLTGPRGQIETIFAHDGNIFESKQRILRESAGKDILVYRQTPAGQMQGDWLAGIEFIAEIFKADYLSIMLDNLNAGDTLDVRSAVSQLKQFFQARSRVSKFKEKMPAAASKNDVILGVLATLCNSTEARPISVVLAYSKYAGESLSNPDALSDLLSQLEKYGALEHLQTVVAKVTGYQAALSDARPYLKHLLVSAAARTLPHEALIGLEQYTQDENGEFCSSIVRSWMQDEGCSETTALYEACRMVEEECGLQAKFEQVDPSSLTECDIFPVIDEVILQDLMTSIAAGSDRYEDAINILKKRQNLMWGPLFEPYFTCLAQAATIQLFRRNNTTGFYLAKPTEVWSAYTADWWTIDAAYRKFCKAFQESLRTVSVLQSAVHDLANYVDTLYTNWFLQETNRCWVASAENQWFEQGYVNDIPRQRDFYKDHVLSSVGKGRCTVVAICDAMRYGVAQDLKSALETKTKGSTSIDAMQSMFPAETKFGMAALLPHRNLEYRIDADSVFVDSMPTASTVDRAAVLQKARAESTALQFEDFLKMRPEELKQLSEDNKIIYVYQNTIDTAGHNELGGQGVFDACEKAIEDMVSLVKSAVRHMGAQEILITADHGFLYTQKEFQEIEQLDRKALSVTPSKIERRFAIASPEATSELLIKMNVEDMDESGSTWWAARDCIRLKVQGSSKQYVHGGISLQEVCVPVITFKNMRANSKGYVETKPTSIQLLSSSRRVSNTVFNLEFFQKEAVGGKVVATEYDLVFTDSSGNEVSDAQRFKADKTTSNEAERTVRVRFNLKPGIQWQSTEAYYLVVRDTSTGAIAWKEPFSIEVSFAPMDDFGW
ncbi:BREX-1 system phosphatase PglZ type A [Anaerotardibacter muris]|uniref:BREX-1 system phosphatase PglZ type A n=1 Tax=Anaerotardibacter muris TaxID=2941505 RepID=UPI0020405758|nr:BREX-1 system phosphatase PglZ type A [Anaerotardibacter muris]